MFLFYTKAILSKLHTSEIRQQISGLREAILQVEAWKFHHRITNTPTLVLMMMLLLLLLGGHVSLMSLHVVR
jgi:hypothetical protein